MADVVLRGKLDSEVPSKFGKWVKSKPNNNVIINPETQQEIDKIYTEVLSSNYVNEKGKLAMLLVAYGRDQSDYLAVHKPEVCYPAAGFEVTTPEVTVVNLDKEKNLQVKYLKAVNGPRVEHIFYWTTYGNYVYKSTLEKKLLMFKYSKENLIGDGLLLRVSVIDQDERIANQVLTSFVQSWYKASNKTQKKRFFGAG